MLVELVTRIPDYDRLPREELTGDIARVVERALRSFTTFLRSGTAPGRAELAFLRESAARRAEEGVPAEVVLTAYHVGVQVVWDSLAPDVRPGDIGAVMAVNSLALRYLGLVTPAVAAGYVDERQAIAEDERSAQHTVLSALLSGEGVDAAVAQSGTPLPPCYLVLALGVGPHRDEAVEGVDAVVAGRRKLRRLRARLDRRGPVLSALTPEGGTALLPRRVGPGVLPERTWAEVDELVGELGRAAGAVVTAGVVAAEPAEVPEAAVTAREVLDVALRFGRSPGAYRLDDVLLEYQMSRPSRALGRLATLLSSLEENDELLRTLEVFLRAGGRRQAASELHVHPNTVDYRLRRVRELTGLNPAEPGGAALVRAALVARAARRT
ncbi:PucR family transcriptional regulator [Saccharothrix lopnurensis]|uniref:PucR family transcriptional regulator n=1 Tax=Saccharothrix lopnurensis TaxID=1670621 RepID=A0ABW1NZ51_9PSEU